jgi:hypothetical protein
MSLPLLASTQSPVTYLGLALSTFILVQIHQHSSHHQHSVMKACSIPPVEAQLLTWAHPLNDDAGAIPGENTKTHRKFFPDNAVGLTTEIRLFNKSETAQNGRLVSLEWSQEGQKNQAIYWAPEIDLSPLNRYRNNNTNIISPPTGKAIITTATLLINGEICTLTSEA